MEGDKDLVRKIGFTQRCEYFLRDSEENTTLELWELTELEAQSVGEMCKELFLLNYQLSKTKTK